MDKFTKKVSEQMVIDERIRELSRVLQKARDELYTLRNQYGTNGVRINQLREENAKLYIALYEQEQLIDFLEKQQPEPAPLVRKYAEAEQEKDRKRQEEYYNSEFPPLVGHDNRIIGRD